MYDYLLHNGLGLALHAGDADHVIAPQYLLHLTETHIHYGIYSPVQSLTLLIILQRLPITTALLGNAIPLRDEARLGLVEHVE